MRTSLLFRLMAAGMAFGLYGGGVRGAGAEFPGALPEAPLLAASASPPNDQFANAIDLGSKASLTVSGDNRMATAEANEPNHCQLASTPSHSLWWKWTAPSRDRFLLDTKGSDFNTVVAVYEVRSFGTPEGLSNLQRVECGYDREYPDDPKDRTSFLQIGDGGSIEPGRTYWFVVDTQDGSTGHVQLRLQPDVVPFGLSLSVDNLQPGGVVTNSADITIRLLATSIVSAATFQLFDSATLLFERDVVQNNGVNQTFVWQGVPLGPHQLRLKIVRAANFGNVDGPTFDFTVAPRAVGIARIENFATDPNPPPQGNNRETDTYVSGTLVIRNAAAISTFDLRVRLIQSATAFTRGANLGDPPPAEEVLEEFPLTGRGPLQPGGEWKVDFLRSQNLRCYEFQQNGSRGTQYHIVAVLEQLEAGRWLVLDKAKIFSSVAKGLIPPNEGVTGKASPFNTGKFTVATGLLVTGPSSVEENSQVTLSASVRLSDNSTVTATPSWSVNPPFTISPAGVLSVGALSANATASVVASYDRTINTISNSITVTAINLPDPVIVEWSPPLSIVFGAVLGSEQLNATANVAGRFSYVPAAGTKLSAGGGQSLSVTFVPTDPGLQSVKLTRLIAVLRAAQSINFEPIPDQVLGSPAVVLKALASSQLPVVFALEAGPAVLGAGSVQPMGEGVITIRAEQLGDQNYAVAAPVRRSFLTTRPSLLISGFRVEGGRMRLMFSGIPSRSFVLETSRDLSRWSEVATQRLDASAAWSFETELPLDRTEGYYRVRLLP